MSQVNLQLLAKELGLSIGTVSKALRDSHEISIETKKSVLDLAKKLNYSPNPYASSLRRKRSNTIAVIIPEVADSFFSLAIKGIEEVAQQKGYHVLIYLTYESYEKEQKILEDCKNGRVDGVLISVSIETTSLSHIDELQEHNIPVVFFDRTLEKVTASKITTDDFDSAYKATAHLVNCGCKNIVYLSIADMLFMNNNRIAGFRKALAEANLNDDTKQIVNCPNNAASTYTTIKHLLSGEDKPDGIIASVEKLAIPVYAICDELGIQISSQLKVVCFSTTAYAQILKPGLTTITQPANEIGKIAATVLFKSLRKASASADIEHIVLPSELQIRESAPECSLPSNTAD
jgi:LacI family transcriptional regulator